MPQPPEVGLFTRYVLENPWPVGLVLLAVGACFGWIGLREGLGRNLKIAVALLALGAAALLTGAAIETAGEHAKATTRAFVAAVVSKDIVAADRMLAPNAVLSVGSPTNPGIDKELINESLAEFAQRFTVEDNSLTMFKGYTESADAGEVHMACLTTVQEFPYPNASRWVVRVRREDDGAWRITGLTCVSINDRTPPLDLLR